jgi:ribose transport system permease protein
MPRIMDDGMPVVSRQVVLAFGALVLVLAVGCVFPGPTASGGEAATAPFFKLGTHADALWLISGYGILACGMTVVIVTGGIDLAVGSVVALSGVVFAKLVIERDLGGWAAIPSAVGAGALAGLTAGWLVAWARLAPFLATLAMMALARGLAKWLAGGRVINRYPYPALLETLNGRFDLWGFELRYSVVLFVFCVALTLVLLRGLRIGRHLYAVGDNEEAARLSGVNVRATKLAAYGYCGLLAGLAGVLFAANVRQGNPDDGVGYELTAIAMVVVGGTSLSGGRGGVVLTVLGALTIGYLRKILDVNAVDTPLQLMATGVILVLAVLAQGFRRE